jgi:hypothetical protein
MLRFQLLVCVAVLAGCGTTQQVRKVRTSGFLGDYSQLDPGKSGEALLVYRNPAADFVAYDRVLVDPVAVWRGSGSELEEVPEEDLEKIANYLHRVLVDRLSEDYEVVSTPGPRTLRIRAAITELAQSWVPLDTVSTIEPFTRLASEVTRLATGTHLFVGNAGVEGEIVDATSGARLLAAVDHRAGEKVLRGSQSSWDDVKGAFDFWATRLRDRLRQERGGESSPGE